MMLAPILACSDVSKAIDYYTQKLGFQLAWSTPPNEKAKTELACVRLGTAEILLGVVEGYVKPEDINRRGIGIQIYISLPDTMPIDEIYAKAQAQGAAITRALQTRDWGERAFNVNDMDGYNLMIAQRAERAD